MADKKSKQRKGRNKKTNQQAHGGQIQAKNSKSKKKDIAKSSAEAVQPVVTFLRVTRSSKTPGDSTTPHCQQGASTDKDSARSSSSDAKIIEGAGENETLMVHGKGSQVSDPVICLWSDSGETVIEGINGAMDSAPKPRPTVQGDNSEGVNEASSTKVLTIEGEVNITHQLAKVARMNPEKYREVKVKDYQISINGKKFSTDSLHRLPKELSPHSVYTPRSDKALVFFTRYSPFSNHYACRFDLEGLTFSCVEQYLAVQRAHLAKDKILARRAMESKDPADHKMILNQLHNDNRDEWRDKAPDFILEASRAKFMQNPLLKDLLMSTYPLRIGEASKDTFWGIGLPLESQHILETDKWAPEGNLQGRTLMAVRRELMAKGNDPIPPETEQSK